MKKFLLQLSIFFISLLIGIGIVAAMYFSFQVQVLPVQNDATMLRGVAEDADYPNYEGSLAAMKETSLRDVSHTGKEIYRFLWLRSFNNPIVVRVEYTGSGFLLTKKELEISSNSKRRSKLRQVERKINQEEWYEFVDKVKKSNFWFMESFIFDNDPDGSRWVLEAVKDSRYHLVDRYSPTEGVYFDACLYLINLSGFKAEHPNDIY